MKTKIKTVIIMLILFSACPAGAVIWTEGYHQMVAGENYGESAIYNDVKLDIFGGDILHVYAFNSTTTNWYEGQMYYFLAHDNSVVNIYGGGLLIGLGAGDNSQVNLYAYDIQYHLTGGHWDDGWIEGRYLVTNNYFAFDLWGQDTYSHIRTVPEPTTLFLLGLGGLLLRTIKNKSI